MKTASFFAAFMSLAFCLPLLLKAGEGAPPETMVRQNPRGQTTLHARDATVHGTRLRYEPEPHKNTLGFWTEVADWAEWTLDINQPGDFHVEVLQGCGRGQGGSEILVEIAGQKIPFIVQDTGHFQNFTTIRIGRVRLGQGAFSLSMKPQVKKARAIMDIQEVRLVPVSTGQPGSN